MTLPELFGAHGNLVLFISLCWVVAGIWVAVSVAAMVEAKMGTPTGLAILVGAVTAAGFATYSAALSPIIFAVMLLLSFGVPAANHALNRRDHALIEADAVKRCLQALSLNPRNVAAHEKLAKLCHQVDLLAPAVAHMEIALQAAPHVFTTEKFMLKSWQRDLATGQYPLDLVCPRCRASNDPVAVLCANCNAPMVYLIVAGGWLPQGMTFKLVKAWSIALCVAIAAPLAAALLPPVAALFAVVLIVGAGLYAFWLAVR